MFRFMFHLTTPPIHPSPSFRAELEFPRPARPAQTKRSDKPIRGDKGISISDSPMHPSASGVFFPGLPLARWICESNRINQLTDRYLTRRGTQHGTLHCSTAAASSYNIITSGGTGTDLDWPTYLKYLWICLDLFCFIRFIHSYVRTRDDIGFCNTVQ